METLTENEAKENCVFSWRDLPVMAEQNLNRRREQQVTCILNQILNVNFYYYE